MIGLIDVHRFNMIVIVGVFVSNLTNSMTRTPPRVSPGKRRDQAHKQRGDLACNWRVGESRTNSPGHFNSSRLMKVPPSWDLIFFWTRLVVNSSEACVGMYPSCSNFLWGPYLGAMATTVYPTVKAGAQRRVPLWTREVQCQNLSPVPSFKKSS